MNPAMVPLLMLLFSVPFASQQTVAKPPVLCQSDSLPSTIQRRLKEDFGSWMVKDVANLSQRAHGRWEAEKPLKCPGIVVGQFENTQTVSYALLLVPVRNADAGYRFLVFTQKTRESRYEMRILDKLDESGAANYFLRATPVGKFFSEKSKKRFRADAADVILLFDAAEKEYEVDAYYWSEDRYRHDPVDY